MSPLPLRPDLNCSIVFTELPLLERPRAAAEAGFRAIELWWPFPDPVPAEPELAALEESLEEAGVVLVGLNLDGGDLPAGDRGLVSLPGMEHRFEENLECAMALAERLSVPVVNALYGNRVEGVAPEAQDEVAVSRLCAAVAAGDRAGVQVVLETQNRTDSPAYPLTTLEDLEAVAARVAKAGGGRLRLLCDLYHLAMEGIDLPSAIEAHHERIAHVQIADVPGRHEPGTGTIDFYGVLSRLSDLGYDRYVGGEYRPSMTSAESLSWREALFEQGTRG